MSTNTRDNDKKQAKQNYLQGILDKVDSSLFTLIESIIVLCIEYFLFMSSTGNIRSRLSPIIAVFVLVLVGSIINALFKWYNKNRYVRESFAFPVLILLLSLALILFFSIIAGVMPWYPFIFLISLLLKQDFVWEQLPWTGYALLLILWPFTLMFLRQKYKNDWTGLKSEEQYQREQRGEPSSILLEGIRELRRILRREPPLPVYADQSIIDYISQLAPPEPQILAWKNQAKELLGLACSSYAFGTDDQNWHATQECWVGDNLDTNDLVFLYPRYTIGDVTDEGIAKFIAYADRITSDREKATYEIIVAIQEQVAVDNKCKNVRFETENSLLDKLINFTDYRNEIRKRVENNCLPESDLTINDVYVPSQFHLSGIDEPIDDVEAYLAQWLEEPGQRHLALLGEYGQGKSTVCLLFTYHLLWKTNQQPSRIPILIDLRGKSPRNLTSLELLGAWAAPYNINPQSLFHLHKAGRVFLIFEGFDEMALIGDSDMRLRHFKTLWDFAYPGTKILISGRPNFFLDDKEMQAALGIHKLDISKPYAEVLRLVPFTSEQIRDALRKHKSSVREQICSIAVKSSRFFDIVSRPSMLHVVAMLWETEKLSEKVEQLTSAYVMELFLKNSYLRQGIKQDESPEFMALTTSEREYFMKGVATYMAVKNLPNQISVGQLNDLVGKLIDAIPDTVSTRSDVACGESRRPLRFRLTDKEHGIEHVKVEHVKTDVRSCGILVDDPAALGTFRFGHKSFMEYLFAAVVNEYIQANDATEARSILKATQGSIDDILQMPVSVDFLAELIVAYNPNTSKSDNYEEFASQLLKAVSGLKNRYQSVLLRNSMMINTLFLSDTADIISFIIKLFDFFKLMIHFSLSLYSHLLLACIFFVSLIIKIFFELPMSLLEMVFMGFCIICTVLFRLTFFSLKDDLQKIKLWNLLCSKVGIPDDVMHRVAGTWIFPRIRKQPFDYFLDKEDDQ